MRKLIRVAGMVAGVLAGFRLVFAYIDPNTGGLLFQFLAIILASLTGILLFFSRQIRIVIARVKRILRGAGPDASKPLSANSGREGRE